MQRGQDYANLARSRRIKGSSAHYTALKSIIYKINQEIRTNEFLIVLAELLDRRFINFVVLLADTTLSM